MHGRGNSYPPHVRRINDAFPGLRPLRFRRLPLVRQRQQYDCCQLIFKLPVLWRSGAAARLSSLHTPVETGAAPYWGFFGYCSNTRGKSVQPHKGFSRCATLGNSVVRERLARCATLGNSVVRERLAHCAILGNSVVREGLAHCATLGNSVVREGLAHCATLGNSVVREGLAHCAILGNSVVREGLARCAILGNSVVREGLAHRAILGNSTAHKVFARCAHTTHGNIYICVGEGDPPPRRKLISRRDRPASPAPDTSRPGCPR